MQVVFVSRSILSSTTWLPHKYCKHCASTSTVEMYAKTNCSRLPYNSYEHKQADWNQHPRWQVVKTVFKQVLATSPSKVNSRQLHFLPPLEYSHTQFGSDAKKYLTKSSAGHFNILEFNWHKNTLQRRKKDTQDRLVSLDHQLLILNYQMQAVRQT